MRGQSKSAGPAATAEFAEWLRRFREKMGYKTQQKMADALEVQRSAVSAWENGLYRPSAETIIKIGNLARAPLCMEAWKEAGIDTAKLWVEEGHGQRELATEATSVPLLQLPDPFDHPERVWPLARSVAASPGPLCVRIGAPVALFPFGNQQLAVVDGSDTDWWRLIESGRPVAVYFERYPEKLEVLVARRIRAMQTRGRSLEEEAKILERITGPAQTNAEELAKRWAPDKDGTISLQALHVGWLAIERPNDPEFAILGPQEDWREFPPSGDPWRILLRGAAVTGVGGGGAIPLSAWETKKRWRDHPPLPVIKHIRLLGKVIDWMSAQLAEVSASVPSEGTASTPALRMHTARQKAKKRVTGGEEK